MWQTRDSLSKSYPDALLSPPSTLVARSIEPLQAQPPLLPRGVLWPVWPARSQQKSSEQIFLSKEGSQGSGSAVEHCPAFVKGPWVPHPPRTTEKKAHLEGRHPSIFLSVTWNAEGCRVIPTQKTEVLTVGEPQHCKSTQTTKHRSLSKEEERSHGPQ